MHAVVGASLQSGVKKKKMEKSKKKRPFCDSGDTPSFIHSPIFFFSFPSFRRYHIIDRSQKIQSSDVAKRFSRRRLIDDDDDDGARRLNDDSTTSLVSTLMHINARLIIALAPVSKLTYELVDAEAFFRACEIFGAL